MDGLEPLFDGLGQPPLVIAGPCSAESEEQVMETAMALAAQGIKVFRAGVWKPRTKPGSFEGAGEQALPWLMRVKESTGMKVATEVASARHVREALEAGIDAVWLGARTVANPFAVQEIADALRAERERQPEKADIAVMVKNPVNPDLELWIGAIERIYLAGIRRIGAIHRGFSSYGKHEYRNPPHWAIPIELHRRLPELPVLCDPSHIGGSADLVAPLAQQALDMNFNGLIIESHCCPGCALSDSAQQVTPARLSDILAELRLPAQSAGEESLEGLRAEIDRIDDELIDLLGRRMAVAREIGRYKARHNMPVVQPARYNDLMERRTASAAVLDMSPDFVRHILAAIHEESVRQQIGRRL